MPIGAVKWFDARKGFGFLQPDDLSEEILVHSSSMEEAGIGLLHHGEKVRYDVEWDCGKASACNLVRVA